MAVEQQKQEHPAYLQPYARAVRRHGPDFRALLWASRQTQETRFEAMLQLADPTGRAVLDLGCGCADLLDFLLAHGFAPSRYVGLEGVDELADAAESKGHAIAQIVRADFVREPGRIAAAKADIVFCSGAFNTIDTVDFYAAIANAFAAARRSLVFNFLGSPLLAGMSYLRWRDPRDVLRFARSLTPSVQRRDDYLEGDCTIAMGKAWHA